MIKRILALLLCLVLWFSIKSPVSAITPISGASASLNHKDVAKKDLRTQKVTTFLAKYNSPLTPYAKDIVLLADTYQLDYRLVVAISGVESTFCKSVPFNSYNCWGWKNGNHKFKNYSQALYIVSSTLSKKYYLKGFDTPEKIGPVYAPPSSTWVERVRFFMNLLDDDNTSALLAKHSLFK